VAVVVGGARGICRVTARALADAGYIVGVVDREVVEGASAAASRQADVADAEGFGSALSSLAEEIGPADVLVYGAGITNHVAPVVRMTLDGWRRELDVNLTGAFVAVQHVLPHMVEQGYGRIVVISSVAAKGGLFRQAAYAASKAGLIGLAQTVALEHARHGITCNAVLPGLISTEVVAAMPPEIIESTVAVTPARRTGTMEEVASLIRFLVSEEASYVNGTEVLVDGGQRLNSVVMGSRREAQGRG
jgi:NAD(P)-dependent dehydrogenase (short-subunit alcohol dehydrogenase family)